jgi:hypothetical protein
MLKMTYRCRSSPCLSPFSSDNAEDQKFYLQLQLIHQKFTNYNLQQTLLTLPQRNMMEDVTSVAAKERWRGQWSEGYPIYVSE